MSAMKRFLSYMLIILLFSSCKKESEYLFTGITERDTDGLIAGNIDKSDWKMDDIWTEREEHLFDTITIKYADNEAVGENLNRSKMNLIEKSSCLGYPNPVYSILILRIQSVGITFRFVIVNSNYNIIDSGNQKVSTPLSISLSVSDRKNYKLNDIYRVYYRIEHVNGNVEKGHGDFKIVE
jgi:hypothetical protein